MVADLAKAHNLHPVKGKGVWKPHEMQQRGLVNNLVETMILKNLNTFFIVLCLTRSPTYIWKSIYTTSVNSSIFKKK